MRRAAERAGIDVTAYRIIQEALTNALKHGDGGQAEVMVRYADHYLRVEVLNSGPSALSGGRPDGAASTAATGAGPDPAGPAVTAPRVVIADDQELVRTGFRLRPDVV